MSDWLALLREFDALIGVLVGTLLGGLVTALITFANNRAERRRRAEDVTERRRIATRERGVEKAEEIRVHLRELQRILDGERVAQPPSEIQRLCDLMDFAAGYLPDEPRERIATVTDFARRGMASKKVQVVPSAYANMLDRCARSARADLDCYLRDEPVRALSNEEQMCVTVLQDLDKIADAEHAELIRRIRESVKNLDTVKARANSDDHTGFSKERDRALAAEQSELA